MGLTDVPPQNLLADLGERIEGTPIRARWYVPDLALAYLAGQLFLNATGVLRLCSAKIPGAAVAGARAAVEGMADLLFLGLARPGDEYAKRGARAIVAAERSLDELHDRVQSAGSASGRKRPRKRSEEATDRDLADLEERWSPHLPEARRVLQSARDSIAASAARGQWHWSGYGREDLHARVAALLGDPKLAPVLDSFYKLLSDRTHSGLSAPVLRQPTPDRVVLDLERASEDDRTLVITAVQYACFYGIAALENRYSDAAEL